MALNFPANPSNGDIFENYVYDATIGGWVVNQQQAIARFIASETAPPSPSPGDAWFCTLDATTYIYYDGQWIEASNSGTNGQSRFISSATKPVDVENGDAWFNTNTGQIFIYYVDGDTSQWIEAGAPVLGFDTLSNLSDVDLTSAQNGQVLMYDSGYSIWVPADIYVGPQPAKTITSDNIEIDFSDGIELEQRAVTGDVTFTGANYTSGVKKTIYLEGDTVSRNLTFPIGWNFITDKPTAIGASKKNILDLNSFGTSESTTVGIWLGASAFEPIVATGGTETEINVAGVTYKVHTFTDSGLLDVASIGDDPAVEYLIVAGGGGGGSRHSGGGGAGGLLASTFNLVQASYSAIVGQGGAGGATGSNNRGVNGGDSSIFGLTSIGGGGGGSYQLTPNSGGSGGGSGDYSSIYPGGSGTQGQGYDGGSNGSGAYNGGGGGGGAGAAGMNGNVKASGAGGDGGAGILSSITGNALYYAGGGGGASGYDKSAAGGTGGSLVGGNGGSSTSDNATAGMDNRGGGGGAGGTLGDTSTYAGKSGGSGIIVIRYPITDPN